MNTVSPWLICFGVFLIYPALAFAIGWYIGKHGMPLEIKIKRPQKQSLASDGYGVTADTGQPYP